MPERDKQTDAMARTLAGAGPRPALDRLGTQPAEVTEQAWHDARAMADRVYVDMVDSIDFQRVLIEAVKRHLTVHPDKSTFMAAADIGFGTAEALCHECITEVLLATNTNPPWGEEAESPRYLLHREHRSPLSTPPRLRRPLGERAGDDTGDDAGGDFVAVDPYDAAVSVNFEDLLGNASPPERSQGENRDGDTWSDDR